MKSKKHIFMVLATSLMLTSVGQAGVNLEQEIQAEQRVQQLEDNYILSSILIKKSIRVGQETLKSLQSNLAFIQRIESDASFRQCVVWRDNMSKLEQLGKGAKRLYKNQKVSKKDYKRYLMELKREKSKVSMKINSKQCKEEK